MENGSKDLRATLLDLLGIRCVFPCSIIAGNDVGFTFRCMLEWKEGIYVYGDKAEDIIARFKPLTANTDVGAHAVQQLISQLFTRVQKFSSNAGSKSKLPLDLTLEKKIPSNALHPGIASVYKYVESASSVILLQEYAKHSMLSLSRFHAKTTLSSPTLGRAAGLGAKDLRLRFIVYQLLQVVSFLHGQGLVVDDLIPGHIMLDDDMWLTVPVGVSNRACVSAVVAAFQKSCASNVNPQDIEVGEKLFACAEMCLYVTEKLKAIYCANQYMDIPIGHNEPLTVQWAAGKLSNFDYLMAINYAAGRSMVDPLYHPILPWVTDFTIQSPTLNENGDGGLRDLSMTKFRLSKGDQQLETTYRHSDPPHHVPESLSELTYYIYMARRTPLHVLRRVVRDVFVPEHYPHSIARMFDWTPDECIPEFYSDASVFDSIHGKLGLTDLELPSYAPTPAEFIMYHRRILESDQVSAHIHRWLDLTFGYCLEGQMAIDNMNVPLRHTLSATERIGDSPNLDKHPGFVMLFSKPHPRRHLHHDTDKPAACVAKDRGQLNSNGFSVNALAQDKNLNFKGDLDAFVNLDTKVFMKSLLSKPKRRSEGGAVDSNSSLPVNSLTNKESSMPIPIKHSNSGVGGGGGGDVNNGGLSYSSTSALSSSFGRPSSSGYSGSTNATPKSRSHHGYNSLGKAKDGHSSLSKLRLADDIDLSFDTLCRSAVSSLMAQSQEYKFSSEFGKFLEASYSLKSSCDTFDNNTGSNSEAESSFWDMEFLEALKSIRDALEPEQEANLNNSSDLKLDKQLQHMLSSVAEMQREDMFSIGCIIAEIFLGKPLLTVQDCLDIRKDPEIAVRVAYRETTGLPIVIRRLIAMMLQPQSKVRPMTQEILQACSMSDQETWSKHHVNKLRSGGSESGYVVFGGSFAHASENPDVTATSNVTPAHARSRSLSHGDPHHLKSDVVDPLLLSSNPRLEALDAHCSTMFPSYFKFIYGLIGQIKLCRHGINKVQVVLNNLRELHVVPLEGLGLAMPHLLAIISDPAPFRSSNLTPLSNDCNQFSDEFICNQYSLDDNSSSSAAVSDALIVHYGAIVDVLGFRLGMESTEKLIVPRVVEFLNKLGCPDLLQKLLTSSLWHVLTVRAGVRCFLRHFLPLLLTYLSSGTLQNIAKGIQFQSSSDVSPLWATISVSDKTEWLHLCSSKDIRLVQQTSVLTISSLLSTQALGHGLCSRYVVPPLMCLVGVPQLAVAGYSLYFSAGKPTRQYSFDSSDAIIHEELARSIVLANSLLYADRSPSPEDDNSPSKAIKICKADALEEGSYTIETLEAMVASKASLDVQDMYVVRTIVGLCFQLGDLSTSELVLSKIFDEILPELDSQMIPIASTSTVAALTEVVILLNGILPSLSPEIVTRYYLQPHRPNSYCLTRLLATFPITPSWSVADNFLDCQRLADLDTYVESARRHAFQLELCRLVVSSSMFAGSDACTEFVLPSVDKFFTLFVETYGMIPIESRTMAKAFELGAELFIPLCQLTGAEAFYTTVPSLNPRLEMWLVSIGSGMERKSPPLPSNILPEIVTTSTQESSKKKGFMQWISKRMSSHNSNNNNTTNNKSFQHSSAQPSQSMAASKSFLNAASVMPPPGAHSPHEAANSHTTPSVPSKKGRSMSVNSYTGSAISAAALSHNLNSLAIVDKPISTTISMSSTTSHSATVDVNQADTRARDLMAAHDAGEVGSNQASNNNNSATGNDTYWEGFDELSPVAAHHILHVSTQARLTASTIKTPFAAVKFNRDGPATVNTMNSATEGMELRAIDKPTPAQDWPDYAEQMTTAQRSPTQPDLDSPQPLHIMIIAESSDGSFSPAGPDTSGGDSDAAVTPMRMKTITEDSRDDSEDGLIYADCNDNGSSPRLDVSSSPDTLQLQDDRRRSNNDGRLVSDSAVTLSASSSQKTTGTGVVYPSSFYKTLLTNNSISNISGVSKLATAKKPLQKAGILMKSKVEQEEEEEEEIRSNYHNDMTWLLAGNGKWNVEKDLKDKAANKDQAQKGGAIGRIGRMTDWNPAAQVSMTAPRIAVDVASEAGALFALGMTTNTQWRVEEGDAALVRTLVVNPSESLLLSCSKGGVRLWSLNSHPIKHVSSYHHNSSVPFCATFMRSGVHISTCDGNINVWDVEYNRTLAYLSGTTDRGPYTHMTLLSSRIGVTTGLGPFGDDQLLTCSTNVLAHYDFRSNSSNSLRSVSEWHLPLLPSSSSSTSHFSQSLSEPNQLTCAACQGVYVYVGSSSGGLWVIDRRMGRSLAAWQGHDTAVVKVAPTDDGFFLSVADKSAYLWSCGVDTEPRKIATVKNMPDSSSINLHSNTVIMNTFEQCSGSLLNAHQDVNMPCQSLNVLYCMSGHKLYGGRIPSYDDDSLRDKINLAQFTRDNGEVEELRLAQTYFSDRNKTKLAKQKLQVTSAVLLPLRRLLLLGTEDGLVRVVS